MATPSELVRSFYEARKSNDLNLIRSWLTEDVKWVEPVVGEHMGVLEGADDVIDMLERALRATSGTFTLNVADTAETKTHCSAVIKWSAVKNGTSIHGEELAVLGFREGKIFEASFFAANISNDEAFWA